MGDVEINRRLQAIVKYFAEIWLSKEGDHPIQRLWLRRDALATNQLVILGDAVLFGDAMDAKWVARQTSTIKTESPNNRRGALFELIAANLIRGPTISATRKDFPGFDLAGNYSDGSRILISLKSYGTSSHEKFFRDQGEVLERAFVGYLTTVGVKGLCLRAWAQSYPSAADWRELHQAIPTLLAENPVQRNVVIPVGTWAVAFVDCPSEVQPIASRYLSYQLFLMAPFHENESKNLTDKLEDAAANARKHAKADGGVTAHSVLVRIPETIALTALASWANEYVNEHPKGPIDAVVLYQPTVAETPAGENVIDHGFFDCATPEFLEFEKAGHPLQFSALIGIVSRGTRRQLLNGPTAFDLDRMYVFQRGNFYTLYEQETPGSTIVARMDNMASGVLRHAVMRLHGGDETLMQGIYPLEKSLSLFD
jgi:hypothetical protein